MSGLKNSPWINMDKKKKNTIVFSKISFPQIAILIGINLLLVVFSKALIPLFDLILKLTGKIGSLIFGLITTIVFFFILTPISLFRRATGKKMLKLGFEKESDSYYEEWEESADFTKQY